jgi:hypothetical protein
MASSKLYQLQGHTLLSRALPMSIVRRHVQQHACICYINCHCACLNRLI